MYLTAILVQVLKMWIVCVSYYFLSCDSIRGVGKPWHWIEYAEVAYAIVIFFCCRVIVGKASDNVEPCEPIIEGPSQGESGPQEWARRFQDSEYEEGRNPREECFTYSRRYALILGHHSWMNARFCFVRPYFLQFCVARPKFSPAIMYLPIISDP